MTLHSWFSSLVSKSPTANNSDNDKEEEEEKKRKNKNNPTTVVTMSGFTKWWNTHGPIWALKRQETKLFKQEAIEALEKMDGAKKGSLFKITKAVYLTSWVDNGFYTSSWWDPFGQDEDIFIPVRGMGTSAFVNGNLVLCEEGSHIMFLGWQETKFANGDLVGEQWPIWLVGSQKAAGWIRTDCFEKVSFSSSSSFRVNIKNNNSNK